jgi:aspartyl protease family protein
MRSSSAKSVALAMLFMVSAGLPGLQADGSGDAMIRVLAVTELKSGTNGHYFVKASINGNPINVVVDTGATSVALSYEDADKAGLKPRNLDYSIPIQTANGVAKAARIKLRRVEINGVRVDDVEGIVLQPGALNGTLLGMSFLSKLRGFSVENGVLTLKN